MKVFQILNGFCHWDATKKHGSAEVAREFYAPDCIFVDAPDYVFEGWAFDENAEGDARFIKPEPPEGWLYDEETGTFYMEGWEPPESDTQKIARLETENKTLQAQIKAVTDRNDFIEDCIAEMAMAVYANE